MPCGGSHPTPCPLPRSHLSGSCSLAGAGGGCQSIISFQRGEANVSPFDTPRYIVFTSRAAVCYGDRRAALSVTTASCQLSQGESRDLAPPLGELSPQVTEGVSFIRGVSKGSLRLGRPLDNVPPARSGPRGRAKFGLPGEAQESPPPSRLGGAHPLPPPANEMVRREGDIIYNLIPKGGDGSPPFDNPPVHSFCLTGSCLLCRRAALSVTTTSCQLSQGESQVWPARGKPKKTHPRFA